MIRFIRWPITPHITRSDSLYIFQSVFRSKFQSVFSSNSEISKYQNLKISTNSIRWIPGSITPHITRSQLSAPSTTLHHDQENMHLSAEKDKFMADLDRMREAGLLKRDEIAKLSEQNMKFTTESEQMSARIESLNAQIEEMEAERERHGQQMKDAQDQHDGHHSATVTLENEIEGMTKKLELKDSKIAEYEMEIANLEDDRNQLKFTLNQLNAHVGKVQDDKSQMDQDFTSLADEKIKIQQESRKWKSQYNAANDELGTLRIDYEKLEKQLAFEQGEHEKKRVEVKQKELEQKELNDQIKQMKALKTEYKVLLTVS